MIFSFESRKVDVQNMTLCLVCHFDIPNSTVCSFSFLSGVMIQSQEDREEHTSGELVSICFLNEACQRLPRIGIFSEDYICD